MATMMGTIARQMGCGLPQTRAKNEPYGSSTIEKRLSVVGRPAFPVRDLPPAQNPEEPKEVLLRLRENVMSTVGRLPKYVCTKTVDRKRYEPADPEYGTNGTRRRRSGDETVADARRGAGGGAFLRSTGFGLT